MDFLSFPFVLVTATAQIIVTSILVIKTQALNRDLKGVDTSIKCQERYEKLLDQASSITSEEEANRHYDRFWGAQADQFLHWQNSMIPYETYLLWMKRRREKFRKNSSIGGVTF
ncbi:hypothetical protein [uncultured Tateyamaria sp.]|uniref:hypothetical protein n=1 Tax=uncultured Tateyamaria sp. TaxID=455651 RepID=UPI002610B6AA|nr:hypothetical protein [uncultured Tateyamaria sp.]